MLVFHKPNLPRQKQYINAPKSRPGQSADTEKNPSNGLPKAGACQWAVARRIKASNTKLSGCTGQL